MKTKAIKRDCDDDDTVLDYDDGATTMDDNRDWVNGDTHFRWTTETTRLMLELRFERHVSFQERLRQKKEIWAEIAAEMNAVGHFDITGEACDLKYRNLLQTYKKNRLKEERGLQSRIGWEYYEFFKENMKMNGAADEFEPSLLCDTVCVEDDDACDTPANDSEDLLTVLRPVREKRRRASPEKTKKDDKVEPMVFIPSWGEPPSTNDNKARPTRSSKRRRASSAHESNGEVSHPDASPAPVLDKQEETPHSAPPVASSKMPNEEKQNSWRQQSTGAAPKGLTDSESHECQVFGESIGLQLANISDPRTRALLQFKMQELLYLAKTDRLID